MTDARPRRRWPKRAVRAVAWSAAGAAFLTGLGALGAAPQPSAAAVAPVRQKVIIRRIVERVVVVDPVAAPVTIPAGSSASTGQAPSVPAPAPAPAPTSSGGSHG
jgi:hypothetical protein